MARLSVQDAPRWWRGGVLYQIYPRSWYDSDGDGIGDIPGVINRLDYLHWLGIDGIWLNPITASPNHDWGYDVSDYRSVHPELGTLESVDQLVTEARKRAIAVVLDVVPSHTSDQHPWFVEAKHSKTSRYRDYYVWRRPGARGSLPNNWIGYFGQPAWSFDKDSGEYYLHNFSPHQPQLNWWNARVRAEFDEILHFWFKRGIAGVRLDAVQALLYDRRFRDNPRATRTDSGKERQLGQQFKYNANQPGIHGIVRRWRSLTRRYHPARLLFGETWVPSIEDMARYYGTGADEFDLAWNVSFLQSRFAAIPLRAVIQRTLQALPEDAWPAWAISTHDNEGRATTRWCRGDSGAIRCALLLLLTLRGTPIIYYGDEIGMTAPSRNMRELYSDKTQKHGSRDPSRTPMQWQASSGAGFTTARHPWLPIGNATISNVETQRADPGSVLFLVRDLIALRRRFRDLALGAQVFSPSPAGTLAWHRGAALVAVNLGATTRHIKGHGTIAICTDRTREQEPVNGNLELRAREAAVVLAKSPASSAARHP